MATHLVERLLALLLLAARLNLLLRLLLRFLPFAPLLILLGEARYQESVKGRKGETGRGGRERQVGLKTSASGAKTSTSGWSMVYRCAGGAVDPSSRRV